MAVLIHVGNHSFTLADGQDTNAVLQDIQDAVDARGSFKFNADINGAPLTVWVNTAVAEVVVYDQNGVGIGFFHG